IPTAGVEVAEHEYLPVRHDERSRWPPEVVPPSLRVVDVHRRVGDGETVDRYPLCEDLYLVSRDRRHQLDEFLRGSATQATMHVPALQCVAGEDLRQAEMDEPPACDGLLRAPINPPRQTVCGDPHERRAGRNQDRHKEQQEPRAQKSVTQAIPP